MISGKVQTEQDGRDRIVEQLSYLIDEAIALRHVLEDFPDDILTARPYEGEPSVADLLATLVERERGVRIPNVKTLVSSGDKQLVPAASVPLHSVDPEGPGVTDTLNDLISVRGELLSVVTAIEGQSWEHAGELEGSVVTLAQYLFQIVQEDLDLLRLATQRVHESRPIGSPGFTAR